MHIKNIFSTQTFLSAKKAFCTKTVLTHATAGVASAFFAALMTYLACRKKDPNPRLQEDPQTISIEMLGKILNKNDLTPDNAEEFLKTLQPISMQAGSSTDNQKPNNVTLTQDQLRNIIARNNLRGQVTQQSQMLKSSVLNQLHSAGQSQAGSSSFQLNNTQKMKEDLSNLLKKKPIDATTVVELKTLFKDIKDGCTEANVILDMVQAELQKPKKDQNWHPIAFVVIHSKHKILNSTVSQIEQNVDNPNSWQNILREKVYRLKHHLRAINKELGKRNRDLLSSFLAAELPGNLCYSSDEDSSSSDWSDDD